MALKRETIIKLRAVKASILAEPEMYDQGNEPTGWDTCGTACCMAGWAVWNDVAGNLKKYQARFPISSEWREQGSKALGLSVHETDNLFDSAHFWPDPFNDQYFSSLKPSDRAKVAASRIEHFIKTGGAE